MGRFKLGLNSSQVDDVKDVKDVNELDIVKIIDTVGELEPLVVSDRDIGREWVRFLNSESKLNEVEGKVFKLKEYMDCLDDFNYSVVETLNSEDDVLLSELFLLGYYSKVDEYNDKIDELINEILDLYNERRFL